MFLISVVYKLPSVFWWLTHSSQLQHRGFKSAQKVTCRNEWDAIFSSIYKPLTFHNKLVADEEKRHLAWCHFFRTILDTRSVGQVNKSRGLQRTV